MSETPIDGVDGDDNGGKESLQNGGNTFKKVNVVSATSVIKIGVGRSCGKSVRQ